MNKLHPGAKWQFRTRVYFLLSFLGIFLEIFLVIPLLGLLFKLMNFNSLILPILLVSLLSYFLFIILISETYTQMSYNRWFYEFTKDGLRLERGVIWKKYSNIPYERIQNVDVSRGIIARMLGFSTIMIQTAGFSGVAMAEGTIPAVEMKKAEELRDFIIKKISSRRK